MSPQRTRNYNCKNEELPIICSYVAVSLERDLGDFTAFSAKFNQTFLETFNDSIAAAEELINPREETARLKSITDRLYTTIASLLDPVGRLEIYAKMAKAQIPITTAGFGFAPLRKKIHAKDAEGVIQNLHIVIDNAKRYQTALQAQGFTPAQLAQMETKRAGINADNTLQYTILTQRIELVKNNIDTLNALYAQLTEICEVGKNLYKSTNPEKAQEYTLSYLLKKVRHQVKHKS